MSRHACWQLSVYLAADSAVRKHAVRTCSFIAEVLAEPHITRLGHLSMPPTLEGSCTCYADLGAKRRGGSLPDLEGSLCDRLLPGQATQHPGDEGCVCCSALEAVHCHTGSRHKLRMWAVPPGRKSVAHTLLERSPPAYARRGHSLLCRCLPCPRLLVPGGTPPTSGSRSNNIRSGLNKRSTNCCARCSFGAPPR